MRISELSAMTGIPIPTIKFYLREGLMRSGTPEAVNRADYGEHHYRRLRLIRALTEIGGLRLREVRAVLAAIDDERMPLHQLLGVAQYALEGADDPTGADEPALALVDATLLRLRWGVKPEAPARRSMARAITSLQQMDMPISRDVLVRYGHAVGDLAATEVNSLAVEGPRAETVEQLVVGTVLYEAILNALRRMAHEHHSSRRFAGP